MVQGLGFRVQGSGFRVQGSEFSVQGSGFRVQGSGIRVEGVWDAWARESACPPPLSVVACPTTINLRLCVSLNSRLESNQEEEASTK